MKEEMKQARSPIVTFAVWSLFVLIPLVSFGQSTGTIRGVAKDPSGAILPGVNVAVVNLATQQKTETITSESGTYTFPFLTPGDYNFTADLPGFNHFGRDKIH